MTFRALRLLSFVLLLAAAAPVLAQPSADGLARPTWLPFDQALDAAEDSGKMVVVDVWSRRCGWCRKMQDEVYTQPELLSYLNEYFETGRLDIDIKDDTLSYMGYELSSADLSVGFGASGTPTTIFLTSDGSYVTRLPGFHTAEDYMPVLRFIGSGSYRDMNFQEYVESQGQ